MNNFQIATDKTAIFLSALCAVHCLALPFIIVLIPSVAGLIFNTEAFHLWMVLAVIPTSLYALTLGCKQHKRVSILISGLLGLTCLVLAVFAESHLSEAAEKLLTTIGAGIIAYGHYRNYRLCQTQKNCNCNEHSEANI